MKNKMKKLINLMALLLLLGIVSCKKETAPSEIEKEQDLSLNEKANFETSFAKILAKAIKSDESLRNFIKTESLKQFDNDYDVLYQAVKDDKINGETLREKLLKFTTVKELDSIENGLPLLTIFVPTVPNFNPGTWDTSAEIPLIAVLNNNNGKMPSVSLYNEAGYGTTLKFNEVPGFPILVVKQNERILINNQPNKIASTKEILSMMSINKLEGRFSYSFVDNAFNGSVSLNKVLKPSKSISLNGSISRIASPSALNDPNTIDQVNVDAYNSGSEWHRDYIYYGIGPNKPNGAFRNNYSEFITSFKFLTPSALGIIADQDGDPKPYQSYGEGNMPCSGNGPCLKAPGWYEGSFEFRITVLINSKNGLGNELTKVISVNPRDLFDLQYQFVREVKLGSFRTNIYEFKSAIPKEYHPNIELIPWDLENYGTAWKFIFYEIDPAQEIVNSYENTTTFVANFEINGGVKDKIGAKFGVTATTTEKRAFSVKTTLSSDFLGEATLTFDQPIIIGTSGNNYITREITTGNLLAISVEPRKVF